MHRFMRAIWMGCAAIALSLLLSTGCDTAGTEEPAPQYVVEAYLIAGEALPPVRLTRTAGIGARYRYDSLAVRGAEIAVVQLDADGDPLARYPYRAQRDTAGVYIPFGSGRVVPLATYRLEATVPATGQQITAMTTVPDTFSIVNANARAVVYQGPEQLAVTLTRSRYPGRDQSFYLFSTESLEPRIDNLTPLIREFVDDEDDFNPGDFRMTSSPALNEESYDLNADGTLTIRLPWFAIAFYGPNRTTINAIDDNLYDFVRTQGAQQGGGGFTPGTIPNVIERVDGGTGVFGSLARQSYDVTIQRPEDAQP
jgi:hypothetical protein